MKGKNIPPSAVPKVNLANLLIKGRSVSRPVINNRNIAPNKPTTSSKCPCILVAGNAKPINSGNILPRKDGPQKTPAKISPITEGCPNL